MCPDVREWCQCFVLLQTAQGELLAIGSSATLVSILHSMQQRMAVSSSPQCRQGAAAPHSPLAALHAHPPAWPFLKDSPKHITNINLILNPFAALCAPRVVGRGQQGGIGSELALHKFLKSGVRI